MRGSRSQSEDVNKAASLIRRDVLNQVIAKNEELGFQTDVIPEDYFPRLWNRKALYRAIVIPDNFDLGIRYKK